MTWVRPTSARGPIVLFVLLVSVAQCAAPQEPLDWAWVEARITSEFPNVPSVTAAELASLLQEGGQSVTLLDVRTPEEFAVSHLDEAHLVGSPEDAASLIARLAPDGLVVAYCSVGYRSAAVVAELSERGIKNVVNLQGSIFAWANEGHSVYRDGVPVAEVHPFNKTWGALLNPDLRSTMTP